MAVSGQKSANLCLGALSRVLVELLNPSCKNKIEMRGSLSEKCKKCSRNTREGFQKAKEGCRKGGRAEEGFKSSTRTRESAPKQSFADFCPETAVVLPPCRLTRVLGVRLNYFMKLCSFNTSR